MLWLVNEIFLVAAVLWGGRWRKWRGSGRCQSYCLMRCNYITDWLLRQPPKHSHTHVHRWVQSESVSQPPGFHRNIKCIFPGILKQMYNSVAHVLHSNVRAALRSNSEKTTHLQRWRLQRRLWWWELWVANDLYIWSTSAPLTGKTKTLAKRQRNNNPSSVTEALFFNLGFTVAPCGCQRFIPDHTTGPFLPTRHLGSSSGLMTILCTKWADTVCFN